VAEYRLFRGWSDAELLDRLERLDAAPLNFDPDMAEGWAAHRSTATVARELPGPPLPHGAFNRLCTAVADYEFSDPDIVTAHFDRAIPLPQRRLLLEVKALGLRYLCGAAVARVRNEKTEDTTYFGFRYDTLEGHIERGEEWFVLSKDHETGSVQFEIAARWRFGDFPNWWSRAGFALLGPLYQRRWHMRAHRRLAFLAGAPEHAIERDHTGRRRLIAHEGPTIEFERHS
jgi:uncharacterized protein (UPF0548 family)